VSRPNIVAVEEDPAALRDVERALLRYAADYMVACLPSSLEALRHLEEHAAARRHVALVLAGQRLGGRPGSEFLARVRHIHPHAKRVLLIEWGAWGQWVAGEAIFEAMSRGDLDHFTLRPSTAPDERFHQEVSGFLLEWAESQRIAPHTIRVVGESWSGRAYELREVLERCALPHTFWLVDSLEGREIVERVGPDEDLPLVVFPNGDFLADPSDADIASATGSSIEPKRSEFDLVIVGAGPAGLSAAVYAASEGFGTLVVDEAGLGGQATASSLIRNYLGFAPGISGGRLARQAYDQAWLFGASFAFMQRAIRLRRGPDRLLIDLALGRSVSARAVVLATGASYRRLEVPELEALSGAGVFYGGAASEAHGMADRDVYVLGGANSAGQTALHLARYAGRVTLVVRAPSLAAGMSSYLVREIQATPTVRVLLETEVVGGGGDGWLEHLVLRSRATGREETVPADGLFLAIGARPRTAWLPPEIVRDDRGFVLTGAAIASDPRWPLERSPFSLETSMPCVLAAGDIRHGSVKRVASAVGEGSVAVQVLHELLEDEQAHPRHGASGTAGQRARS
jgi:thioredoxin reductase (NADPH)